MKETDYYIDQALEVFKKSCLEAEKLTVVDANFNFDKMENLHA